MSDVAILGLAGFIFVGLPAIILGVAFAIDRLKPGERLAQKFENETPRRHRPF